MFVQHRSLVGLCLLKQSGIYSAEGRGKLFHTVLAPLDNSALTMLLSHETAKVPNYELNTENNSFLNDVTLHYITCIWRMLLSKPVYNKCIPKGLCNIRAR